MKQLTESTEEYQIITNNNWYEDNEFMYLLTQRLESDLPGRFDLFHPLNWDANRFDLHYYQECIDNFRRSSLDKKDVGGAILPINISNGHWAACIMIANTNRDGKISVQMIYIDSKGTDPASFTSPYHFNLNLKTILIYDHAQWKLDNNINEFNPILFTFHQQTNDIDCGPLCIRNIIAVCKDYVNNLPFITKFSDQYLSEEVLSDITQANAAHYRLEDANMLGQDGSNIILQPTIGIDDETVIHINDDKEIVIDWDQIAINITTALQNIMLNQDINIKLISYYIEQGYFSNISQELSDALTTQLFDNEDIVLFLLENEIEMTIPNILQYITDKSGDNDIDYHHIAEVVIQTYIHKIYLLEDEGSYKSMLLSDSNFDYFVTFNELLCSGKISSVNSSFVQSLRKVYDSNQSIQKLMESESLYFDVNEILEIAGEQIDFD